MNNEYLKKLSDELRNAREKKKISIDEIFTKTRIDKKFLSAIEQGNFSIMPEVYIRAFLKEYSKTIGLNPDEVLQKYKLASEGNDFEMSSYLKEDKKSPLKKEEIKTKIDQAANQELSNETSSTESSKNKTSIYILSAILILAAIYTTYNLFLDNKSDVIITEKPFEEIISDTENGNSEMSIKNEVKESSDQFEKIEPKKIEPIKKDNEFQPAGNVMPINNEGKLVLTIIGDDRSWIRILSDEINNTEFILDSGVTKVVTADKKFYLHVGNSGGIKLLLNDKDLNFSGSPGKVRKIFVTQNGIEYLRRTPVTINAE